VKTILKYWLLVFIVVTGLAGLLYVIVQQNIRQAANNPQIQLAEQTAAALATGQPVQEVVPAGTVDIANSLAPYLIIFDRSGVPIASTAQLDGQTPIPPSGVFDYVRQHGEDRISWQPKVGVRSAIVMTQFQGPHPGFVLAGRSLREVELREDSLLHLTLLGWSVILVVASATGYIFRSPSISH
jgi:hypothetical protein